MKDFQFAFGAIDRLDYEVNRAAGTIHVWFRDRYEWHPVGFGYSHCPDDKARVSNCVHAAMELKSSGAKDYWMVGERSFLCGLHWEVRPFTLRRAVRIAILIYEGVSVPFYRSLKGIHP